MSFIAIRNSEYRVRIEDDILILENLFEIYSSKPLSPIVLMKLKVNHSDPYFRIDSQIRVRFNFGDIELWIDKKRMFDNLHKSFNEFIERDATRVKELRQLMSNF